MIQWVLVIIGCALLFTAGLGYTIISAANNARCNTTINIKTEPVILNLPKDFSGSYTNTGPSRWQISSSDGLWWIEVKNVAIQMSDGTETETKDVKP